MSGCMCMASGKGVYVVVYADIVPLHVFVCLFVCLC